MIALRISQPGSSPVCRRQTWPRGLRSFIW